MADGPPVLEYAQAERVRGDQYRLWFLLAGLPAMVGLCVPIVPISGRNPVVGHLLASLAELVREIARGIARGGFSAHILLLIALGTVLVAPLSATAWRVVRLRGRESGRLVWIVGLSLSGIHVAGLLMLSGTLVFPQIFAAGIESAAPICVALVVCVGLILWSRTPADLGACVLVVLAGVEMVVWAFAGLAMLCGRVNSIGELLLGIVFMMTGLVRGWECGHVLSSRRLGAERV